MKRNPTLPIDRSLLKDYVVNKGISDLSHYKLIRGTQLPEQIIIGIVDQAAHSGNITKIPLISNIIESQKHLSLLIGLMRLLSFIY